MLIRTYGWFWKWTDVYVGAGSNSGKLLGVPAKNVTANPIDFRDQRGVYALYAGYDLVYAGQNGNQELLARLKQHLRDDLADRWDRFSWFGVRYVLNTGSLSNLNQAAHPSLNDVLNHIEAIMIYAAEPKFNRQGGRFGDGVKKYVQIRDDRLGGTDRDLLEEIWNEV